MVQVGVIKSIVFLPLTSIESIASKLIFKFSILKSFVLLINSLEKNNSLENLYS